MSLKIAESSSSMMSPMAIPATAFFTGTPASMSARLPAQTVAIEEEPFDSKMSEMILTT